MKIFIFILFLISCLFVVQSAEKSAAKKDPNDNKGNTPFFLQDPHDHQCLGAYGFTECSEKALWMLTKRKGAKTYSLVSLMQPTETNGGCLQRIKNVAWWMKPFSFLIGATDKLGLGSCATASAKSWQFEFADSKHVKLSSKQGNKCLVRGGYKGVDKKHKYKSSAAVQPCSKGVFLPLSYHPTAVHEVGFYLKAADGMCYNGDKFKSCSSTTNKLFGIGIKYVGGVAKRYFFDFGSRQQCILARGKTGIEMGPCSSSAALGWSVEDGKLQRHGTMCVARLADDKAALVPCRETHEHISVDVPASYTQEELEELLRNQDKLTPEQRRSLQQQLRSAVRR